MSTAKKEKSRRSSDGGSGFSPASSIHTKMILSLGGIVALSMGVFLARDYYVKDQEILKTNQAVLKEDYGHFLQLVDDTARMAYALASSMAGNPRVQTLFANRDRKGLLAETMPIYKALKKEFGIAQFQFHEPPARSFLRLHKPQKFGDDLSSFRKTVVQVNTEKTPEVGVEKGVAGLGIRGVVPVFHEGKHVGSVEFGFGLTKKFLSELKEKFGFDVSIIVPDGDGFRFLAKTHDVATPKEEAGILRKVLEDGYEGILRLDKAGKRLVIFFGPVRDFSGKVVAVVAVPRDVTASYQELRSTQLGIVLGGGALVLAILGLIYFLIGRLVAKPVKLMKEAFARAGEGDLSTRVEVRSRDELGSLAESFNHFMAKIQESFRALAENAKTLDASADGLRTVAREMTSGVEETSERSSQVAAAAEEMTVSIRTVAGATKQAASNMEEVTVKVKEMEGSFQEIRQGTEKARSITRSAVDAAREASEGVSELGEAARKIGAVTEVITDISEQTALLAMNATIEASRAGEAGKGFAVVANEVKALAKQTAQATLEIKERVDSIQDSTSRAAGRIERISTVVEEIDRLVSSIAGEVEVQTETTEEIAANISQASQGLSEVSGSVEDVSSVSLEIAKDIAEVNQVAGAMAGNSGDVESSAGKLKELSRTLKEMVESFKV